MAVAFSALGMGNNLLAVVIPEDHFFELIGAFAFFVTSILFFNGFRVARKTLDRSWASIVKKLVYLGLAFLFLFGAGEEISWGQRILGFQTPETLSEVNRQEEFNLHNLSAWEASRFLDPDRLFDIFWFLFGVIAPIGALVAPAFKKFASRFIPVVFWGMSILFLYNYVLAKLAKIIFAAAYTFERVSLSQAVQEIKESNYALIFILVGLFAIWDLNKSGEYR